MNVSVNRSTVAICTKRIKLMYNDAGPYVSNPMKHYVDDMWYWESSC